MENKNVSHAEIVAAIIDALGDRCGDLLNSVLLDLRDKRGDDIRSLDWSAVNVNDLLKDEAVVEALTPMLSEVTHALGGIDFIVDD